MRPSEQRALQRSNRRLLLTIALAIVGFVLAIPVVGQVDGSASAGPGLPRNAPRYLRFTYPAAMSAPLPQHRAASQPATLEQSQTYRNASGQLGVYQSLGAVDPADNAFFKSLGSNGRSCFSCHQPADGMSIGTTTLQRLFESTKGRDPVFAPVDGANCPNSVPRDDTAADRPPGNAPRQSLRDAHSLLLTKGLFRVFLPMPQQAEFTLTVVSDPYGCNTNPAYARQVDPTTSEVQQMVSVYRRPRMSANLASALTPALTLGGGGLPNIDFINGSPVVDAATSLPIGGNLMWDGREPTLEAQAVAATLGHAQALRMPTAAQVAEMVSFEANVYAAQTHDRAAGYLTARSGTSVYGGPQQMAGQPASFGAFSLYAAWPAAPASAPGTDTARTAARASIARGQLLFNQRQFSVGNVAGFNNASLLGVTNPAVTTCASCHGNMPAGTDPFPAGQRDIGIGGQAVLFGGPKPARDLPVFKLTCRAGTRPGYYGSEVMTNDPGLAMISGRCADIGRRSVPQLRALAARAPFFSDGSAETTDAVVRFYDKRFGIGLSAGEIRDLANFLQAL